MREEKYSVDESLYRRVRDRIGRPDAVIEVREEGWDFGFCETCSYPEDGFSVYADGVQVWPDANYLSQMGGINFADRDGRVYSGSLSVFGAFNEWLNGRDNWEDYEYE